MKTRKQREKSQKSLHQDEAPPLAEKTAQSPSPPAQTKENKKAQQQTHNIKRTHSRTTRQHPAATRSSRHIRKFQEETNTMQGIANAMRMVVEQPTNIPLPIPSTNKKHEDHWFANFVMKSTVGYLFNSTEFKS